MGGFYSPPVHIAFQIASTLEFNSPVIMAPSLWRWGRATTRLKC